MPVIPRRRRRSRDATMSVLDHLGELRKRLIISLVAVTVGAVAGFVLFRPILRFLTGPYERALLAVPPEARPAGLVYSSPLEPFLALLKVGVFTGFLIALPVVLYQLWRFITPGLTSRERRLAIPFVLTSLLLFAAGTAFAFLVAPRGLSFLFSLGGNNLIPLLTVDRYLGFLIFLILAFGLGFEMPLVLVFLAAGRFISSQQMRGWRRWAVLGSALFAAIATPTQDPYTMLLMMVPLYLLYEGAILVARLMKR